MTLNEIKNASIDALEERTKEIRSMNIDEIENPTEISEELDNIEARKKELRAAESKKKELREKINRGEVETTPIAKPLEQRRKNKLTKENYISSPEYRSGYLKKLQDKPLTVEERAALDLAGVDSAVPESMQNDILKKIQEYAPVLNEATLLHVNGAVKIAIEGTINDAEIHTENEEITPDTDTLVEVSLSTYEIVKLIQISASVKTMTISAFETWLVNMLSESIAMKLENLIFNGTGSSQAKGINAIVWVNGTNAIETSSITSQNVYDLVSLYKEKEGKFYMNRKTLFSKFLPLQDKSKNDLVVMANGKYYVLGYLVELTNSMKDGEAVLGNMRKYVANLAQDITIEQGRDLRTNSYLYSGCANFDGRPGYDEAFVKIKPGA